MTVIAYKAGIMAADTALWSENNLIVGHHRKIVRDPRDGALCACTGLLPVSQVFRGWFLGARLVDVDVTFKTDEKEWTGFYVTPTAPRRVHIFFSSGEEVLDDVDYYVPGCGHEDFLRGALAAGASAEQAVRLALRVGAWARGEVQVELLTAPMAPGTTVVTDWHRGCDITQQIKRLGLTSYNGVEPEPQNLCT